MSAEKTYRKLIPVDPLDMAEMETWLSDLAERGYFLIEFSSIFGIFKKGTPKKIRYRLEPVGEDVYFPEVERRQMYEDNGWKFIASCKKRFYVYKAEDAATPELHTDPVVQSEALKSLERVQRRGLVALFSVVVWLAFQITLLAIRNRLFSGLLMDVRIIDCLFITFWLMAFIIPATAVVKIGRLRRGLRSGRAYDHRGSYKRAAVWRVAAGVLLCAIVATTIAIFSIDRNNARNDYFPITDSAPASVRNLAELGREIDPSRQEATVEYAVQASLFAPVQYTVSLSEPEAAADIDSGVENSPLLIINYYEIAPDALAGPLFNELVRGNCGAYGQQLPSEQLEGVVYSQYDVIQNLVARSGNKVVVLSYFYGYCDLNDLLQQVTSLLTGSQPVS